MIQEVILRKIQKAVLKVYEFELSPDEIHVEHPANEEFGDFSTNIALVLARKLKQAPVEIARTLSYEMSQNITDNLFSKIDFASPGFINFTLNKNFLVSSVNDIHVQKGRYGSSLISSKTKIALEHSNVNPNKAAHVGHLRNACIGQFLERVNEFLGADVEVQYLNNDLGVQVTTSLMGMQFVKGIDPKTYEKYDHYAWDVYAQMEDLISQDPSLNERRQSLMTQLEDSAAEISKQQEELSQKILECQLQTFQNLDFDYDVIVRERDIVSLKLWEAAFEKLKKSDNVYLAVEGENKGCWLVKMDSDDKIIVRSNGVPTYTGKDIAYHMWKFGLLGIDFYYKKVSYDTQEKPLYTTTYNQADHVDGITFTDCTGVLNVIDGKQTYALEAVKQAMLYVGFKDQANSMVHVNYGFVYLSPQTAEKLGIDISDNKSQYAMSGRKGWGIKIDDFIKMVDEKLLTEHGEFEALKDVRNGAIKFEMLRYNTFQDIVFDVDNALNMQGFSGPYIQYTHARAASIMRKAESAPKKFKNVSEFNINLEEDLTFKELSMLRVLYKFPEVVSQSAQEYAPNLLCNYLFDLSQRYNSFYNDTPILKSEESNLRDFRLSLNSATAQVLKNGLFLLGIKAPQQI